jgi:hypothetical protein
MAQKSASESREIAVTGSRIRQGSSSNEASDALNDLPAMQAPKAPDWVLADRGYETFLSDLQTAIRANDRSAVINLVHFPLRVNSGGRSRFYRDSHSVRADYDRIFTPQVRRAILAQQFEELFGSSRGLMIGNGEVWFDRISPPGQVQIMSVNP